MRASAIVVASVLAVAGSVGYAQAEVMQFHADMTGSAETPTNTSAAKGQAKVTFDTADKKLSWVITYSDLTGPATMAHVHGPAPVGKAAPVVVPITGELKSPIVGSATLTEAQVKDLEAGDYYFNIHTEANKGGEIRGQVIKGAEK